MSILLSCGTSPNFFVGHRLTRAVINNASANSSRVWNRRSFTTNYTSGLHSQSVQSSIGIARIGTLAAVVIDTLEHKAISESSEVMTKLTANACIALAVPRTHLTFHWRAR